MEMRAAVRAEGNHVAPVIVTGRDKAKLIFSLVNVCVRVCSHVFLRETKREDRVVELRGRRSGTAMRRRQH